MKDRILLKTNLLVSLVIISGFLTVAVLAYQAYFAEAVKNIEEISDLTSEEIYYQINNTLVSPVNVSRAMANDTLLKELLVREQQNMGTDDVDYAKILEKYLKTYQENYQYDSVFLVSTATGNYYHFNGLDRVLNRTQPEDSWYYGFLESSEEYVMNVDVDQTVEAQKAVTLFINCKIYDNEEVIGVVGVGIKIRNLQKMLQNYREQFSINACFVDNTGLIQISADRSGYDKVSLFDTGNYDANIRQSILNWTDEEEALSFWMPDSMKQTHIIVRYLPEGGWRLVVEQDTSNLMSSIRRQIIVYTAIIFVIVLIILAIIAKVIHRFSKQIVKLERTYEQERKTMFEKATSQLFEDIYVLDITHNRYADEATETYFAGLGAPAGTPFDKCLGIVAEKQIKEEFRQGYIDTFTPSHVRQAYEQGKESLRYDFMISNDGKNYYWIRIIARIMVSDLDGSLYMLAYRQNIDAEKRRENKMEERARTDEMTGLLRKTATQRAIDSILEAEPENLYALFIFDIDCFKQANDRFGHAFGDQVIRKFTGIIRSHFRRNDLLGRIGGDEFAAFLKVPGIEWTMGKAEQLKEALSQDCQEGSSCWHMSASIGIAFAPEDGTTFRELYHRADEALYEVKRGGRGGYSLGRKESSAL